MNIIILNGSSRPTGNTSAMIDAFVAGAKESGHEMTTIAVCKKKIAGCLAMSTAIHRETANVFSKMIWRRFTLL